jgi:hypothetical protein
MKNNLFTKLFSKIWKIIVPDPVLTDIEQLAFDIFKICLYDDDNIRYLNSNNSNFSNKKFIVAKSYLTDHTASTFIVLNSNMDKITIVNHKYKYDISMPTKTCSVMDQLFNDKVESERQIMEKEILDNITQSLDIVLRDFKEKLAAKSTVTTPNNLILEKKEGQL